MERKTTAVASMGLFWRVFNVPGVWQTSPITPFVWPSQQFPGYIIQLRHCWSTPDKLYMTAANTETFSTQTTVGVSRGPE